MYRQQCSRHTCSETFDLLVSYCGVCDVVTYLVVKAASICPVLSRGSDVVVPFEVVCRMLSTIPIGSSEYILLEIGRV